MGMIHGTFIVAENSQQTKDNPPLNLPADKAVEESEQQRLIRELKEKWQQMLAFFRPSTTNKLWP